MQTKEAKKESFFKTKVYLLENVVLIPQEQTLVKATVPKLEKRENQTFRFDPFILQDAEIKPNVKVRLINRNEFLVSIINNLNVPLKLMANIPIGHIVRVTTNESTLVSLQIPTNKTSQESRNVRVIVVGDVHVQRVKAKLETLLQPLGELEVYCATSLTLDKALEHLESIKINGDQKVIAIIIAGGIDFHIQSNSKANFSCPAFVNSLPLGKMADLSKSMHIIFSPILPRYDREELNKKICVINTTIKGQLHVSPTLNRLNVSKENFTEEMFETSGYLLNDRGKEMLAAQIEGQLKSVLSERTETAIVSTIKHEEVGKTTLSKPLRVEGCINGRQVDILLDTGSGINVVNLKVVNQNSITSVDNLELLTASGDTFEPIGETTVDIKLKNVNLLQCAFVAKELPASILLGVPFFEHFKAKIDFNTKTVSLTRNVQETVEIPFSQDYGSSELQSFSIRRTHARPKILVSICDVKKNRHLSSDAETPGTPNDLVEMQDAPSVPNKVIKIRESVIFNPNEVKSVPVYITGEFNSRKITIKPVRHRISQKLDLLTSNLDNNLNEVILRNKNLHKLILYQDAIVGSVKAGNKPEMILKPFPHWEDLKLIQVNQNLSLDDRHKVYQILSDFHDVFLFPGQQLQGGCVNYEPIKIQLEKEEMIYKPPYRLSHKELMWLQKEVERLKECGIVEESDSPYGSPALLIPKGDEFRLVQDFRVLNTLVKKVRFPLPNLESTLMAITSCKMASKLDASHGYWQLKLDENSKKYTGFSLPFAHLCFKVLPQGYANAPAEFQNMIYKMLAGLLYNRVLPYVDDLYPIGTDLNDMLTSLRLCLQRCRKFNLKLNYAKCQIGCEEISVFGYRLTRDGLEIDPEKIQGITNYERPNSVNKVRKLLGLVSYYRRFIKNASIICKPLYDLVKKENSPFQWNDEAEEAFMKIKSLLTSAPVLACFDPELDIQLEVDSCKFGTGAVLSVIIDENTIKPVCYYSCLFSPAEQRYSITELELNGLVKATSRFRPYIYGKKVRVITDHSALKQYTKLQNNSNRLARLAIKLSDYDLDIRYKSGGIIKNTDALSRSIPGAEELNFIATLMLNDIPEQQAKDEEFSVMIAALRNPDKVTSKERKKSRQFFIAEDGKLYKKKYGPEGRDRLLCLPKALRPKVLKAFHDDIESSHPGIFKTVQKICSRFFWADLRKDVVNWVKSCQTCQLTKHRNTLVAGKMTSTKIEPYPFRRIAVDVAGPFRASTSRKCYIVCAIDYFTKFMHAEAVTYNNATTIGNFLYKLNLMFGPIQMVHSDCGASIIADSVKSMLTKMGCGMKTNCPYSPMTSGQVEITFKLIKTIIKQYVDKNQRNWDIFVPIATAALNRHVHMSTGKSPFELLFGVRPTHPIDFMFGTLPPPIPLEKRITRMEEIRQKAMTAILKAQARQRKTHNEKKRHMELEIGSEVLLFHPAVKPGVMKKLSIQYRGPYIITKKITDSIYEINQGSEQHPKLKKIKIDRLRPYLNPEKLRANVYSILASKIIKQHRRGTCGVNRVRKKRKTQTQHIAKLSSENRSARTSVLTIEPRPGKVSLDQYVIPQVISALANKEQIPPPSESQMEANLHEEYKKIFRECKPNDIALTPKNYKNRFDLALYLEELQAAKNLRGYALRDVPLLETTEYMAVQVPGLREEKSVLNIGDKVRVTLTKFPDQAYYGVVKQIRNETTEIDLPASFFFNYSDGDRASVTFMLNRYPFKSAHRALQQSENMDREALFPSKNTLVPKNFNDPIKWINPKIENNPEQATAIKSILRVSSVQPLIIFGPPGTAKTATIVEAINQLYDRANDTNTKILVCAPSNSVVDNITVSLLKHISATQLLRLYPVNRKITSIPEEILKAQCYNKNLKNEVVNFKAHQLRKHTILATTLVGAGKLVSAGLGTSPHFTHIFVDEASLAIEPEILIPWAGLANAGKNPTRIILAGDPFQLSPVIMSNWATNFGLGTSLLERLMKLQIYSSNNGYHPNNAVKLIRNYRSHKTIINLPNKLFYGGELIAEGQSKIITAAIGSNWLPNKNHPVVFHNVTGKEKQDELSKSYYNMDETDVIVSYLHKLLTTPGLKNKVITQENIGVITPYRGQIHKITQKLIENNWSKIVVGTVEQFQGMEKLVVIISTVRSKRANAQKTSLGFLKDPKRFNVMLTRARALNIIVGNANLLTTNACWAQFINQCKQENAWQGEKY